MRGAVDEVGECLVCQAMGQLNLWMRGYYRVLKLARTIVDVAGSDRAQSMHWRRCCTPSREPVGAK
ncbi:MAG: hypothetical protein JW963_09515 [Anaerolineales bacterium]|nr:hypothetical protein [Anaerolineales bacterium]